MTPEQYLQSIGRNEIEKLGSGEKTGEYLITPAELEEYAEINQRDAFEAATFFLKHDDVIVYERIEQNVSDDRK